MTIVHGLGPWIGTGALLGVGTAMVYPTLLAGVLADAFGMPAAIAAIGAITAVSGVLVMIRMPETLPACGAATSGRPRTW